MCNISTSSISYLKIISPPDLIPKRYKVNEEECGKVQIGKQLDTLSIFINYKINQYEQRDLNSYIQKYINS